jgi:catalase-peroxidase
MGGPVFGFAGGRRDVYASEGDTFWGAEEIWVNEGAQTRISEELPELEGPLAAIQMGLIYVNPEGPGGNPDPLTSARDMKATFQRMAMNSEETVALTAGGHAFGKAHGAKPAPHFKDPSSEAVHMQGLGWLTDERGDRQGHITTSGIEGAWSNNPTKWGGDYFRLLFKYEYELTESPAGAKQWTPINPDPEDMAPDARDPNKRVPTMMTTADMALKVDPEFRAIRALPRRSGGARRRVRARLVQADAPRHGSQGPLSRAGSARGDADLAGSGSRRHPAVGRGRRGVQGQGAGERSDVGQLVKTAWASASTYRRSDHRGGANGARIALEPQKELGGQRAGAAAAGAGQAQRVAWRHVARRRDRAGWLGGGREGGTRRRLRRDGAVSRRPRRCDAGLDRGRELPWMEPQADGFRNYLKTRHPVKTEELLLDRPRCSACRRRR